MRRVAIRCAFALFFLMSIRAHGAVDSSQLVGGWVRTNVADIQAMEFGKDGKAQLYYGGGNDAMTADYSMTGDGRLNLSMGGQSMFYLPTLSGDRLQLKQPEMNSVSTYRRLKSGETVAAALAAQVQGDKQVIASRNGAIPAFLLRPDLVMINGGGQGAPPAATLQFAATGNGYAGRIFFDSKPIKMEAVTAEIGNSNPDNPSVTIAFNPGTPSAETFTFHASGAAPNLTLTSNVNFQGVFDNAPNVTVIIKPDAALHAKILENVKGQVAQAEAAKTPVIAMLKDYVVLKGTSQSNYPAEKAGYAEQFWLSRNGQGASWLGQAQVTNLTNGQTEIVPAMASVGMINDKPAVQILTQKRAYLYSNIDTAGGKLGGAWHLPNNPTGNPAAATITQALDLKARNELFTTRKTALLHLGTDVLYHAVLADKYNGLNNMRPPNAVAVTLSVSANGTVSGTAEYPQQGCVMTLAGKEVDSPIGPQLSIHFAGGKANPDAWRDVDQFMSQVQQETWTLSPSSDGSGPMHFSGFAVVKPGPAQPVLGLELLPYADSNRSALMEALAGSAKFKALTPQFPGPDTIIEFKTDPKTPANILGTVISGGSHVGQRTGATFSGPVTDHGKWIEITSPIDRPGSKPSYNFTYTATQTDGGIYIVAFQYNIQQTRKMPIAAWDAIQVK